ncbi:hypothetical protein O181_110225 [Austropuccinia psidii MF-1]|uniref:Uncharacterized protein n=1 Tax=Austropuccinia psidii MF-1 TaxID=1389203 RepID=A0A9Q3JVY3_9BASI|nr:hypothetical protein [Austropuccinia psidii MF-1]
MEEITPILHHFQDFFTGKVPFDQAPKSQVDQEYYEDQLVCKNIHGRSQGLKTKNKIDPSKFLIIESQSKRRGSPQSKLTSTKTSRSQSIAPPKIMEMESSKDSEASFSKINHLIIFITFRN